MIDRHLHSGFVAIFTGSGGAIIALIKPWQEHIEWGLRITLLLVSIASVLIGLALTRRGKKPPGA